MAAPAACAVDASGVGTSVGAGSGVPTAGMVYKLVARQDSSGSWIPVAKASASKVSVGGRKSAYRSITDGVAVTELVVAESTRQDATDASASAPDGARVLQVPLVIQGEIDTAAEGPEGTVAARAHHARGRAELPLQALALSNADPAIPTVMVG